MSNQEAPLSFTTKVGSSNDLFTIRGDDFNSFTQRLLEFATLPQIQEFLNTINKLTPIEQAVVTAFDATVVQQPVQVVPQQVFAPVPPAAQPPAPAVVAPICHHGTKVAKKGNGAKGEWRGWMCPAPKNTPDQCKPAWVGQNTPEWNSFPA